MHTHHHFYFEDARDMQAVAPQSIDLVVTSPPYPMISMWDGLFSGLDPEIEQALKEGSGNLAFERMHRFLDSVWCELQRVLKPGAFACINIGDATRSVNGEFALYSNHARILTRMTGLGFTALPAILWRKQTNAPNKFMGSGMLPAGAYVTLEHEYILIFRKGSRRAFTSADEKTNRRRSAIFWEERNLWFSDLWFDLKGTRQALVDPLLRARSAAYPFELPYRLISMFSVKGDRVLDPFAGIGTTAAAAVTAGRHSIGYEIDRDFKNAIAITLETVQSGGSNRVRQRLADHVRFVATRRVSHGPPRHENIYYGFPVVTRQETDLLLDDPRSTTWLSETHLIAEHAPAVGESCCRNPEITPDDSTPGSAREGSADPSRSRQMALPGFSGRT